MKASRLRNGVLLCLAMLGLFLQAHASQAQVSAPAFYAQLYNQTYISTGPLKGTFRQNKDADGSSWYFSNSGLLPVVTLQNQTVIRDYLNQYLAHVDPTTGTIKDYGNLYYHPESPTEHVSDADDSNTATFLSLAAKYYTITQDTVWWNANAAKMKDIANKTLANVQTSSGLIPNLVAPRTVIINNQPVTFYPVCYLMDNCEDYRGLIDFTTALKARGDADSAKYQNAANRLVKGIVKLYDQNNRYFHEIDGTDVTTFYPLRTAQVFPQLFQIPLVASANSADTKTMYTNGWNFLIASGEPWQNGPEAMTDQSLDGYPAMFLGYVAALRGDRQRAQTQLSYFKATVNDPNNPNHPYRPQSTAINEGRLCLPIGNAAASQLIKTLPQIGSTNL